MVENIDNENGKMVVRGRNEMRTYSVLKSFVINTDNGQVLLDIARDEFIE